MSKLRVPPVQPGTRPELAEIEGRILGERGRVSLLYQVLLNSGPIASGLERMLTAVRNQTSIPGDLRELIILRVAVLNGVVMASEIKRRIEEGNSIDDALRTGATSVLRAVLLTATVAAIGFAPMALSTSAGSEVQQPLATAVIGGVVSSTLLGLFLLPGLLRMFLKDPPHPEEVRASLPPPEAPRER